MGEDQIRHGAHDAALGFTQGFGEKKALLNLLDKAERGVNWILLAMMVVFLGGMCYLAGERQGFYNGWRAHARWQWSESVETEGDDQSVTNLDGRRYPDVHTIYYNGLRLHAIGGNVLQESALSSGRAGSGR